MLHGAVTLEKIMVVMVVTQSLMMQLEFSSVVEEVLVTKILDKAEVEVAEAV